MGLFGKLLGREGAQPKEVAEAPKAEAAEVKSAKETGQERVKTMLESAQRNKAKLFGGVGTALARVGGSLRDAFFTTIGGAEKGGKAAVTKTMEGGRAAATYASETKREAGEIGRNVVRKGNKLDSDLADALSDAFTREATNLQTWVENKVKIGEEKWTNVDITTRQMDKDLTELKKAPLDALLTEAKNNKTLKPVATFIDNLRRLPADAEKAFTTLNTSANEAQKKFDGYKNDARLVFTTAAELVGAFAELPAKVARLEASVPAVAKLAAVIPESASASSSEAADADNKTWNPEAADNESETLIPRGENEEFESDEDVETVKNAQA